MNIDWYGVELMIMAETCQVEFRQGFCACSLMLMLLMMMEYEPSLSTLGIWSASSCRESEISRLCHNANTTASSQTLELNDMYISIAPVCSSSVSKVLFVQFNHQFNSILLIPTKGTIVNHDTLNHHPYCYLPSWPTQL